MRASDRAYHQLRQEIITWRLAPGTVLAEVEQAGRLGVSRTPVREALSRLMAEGLAATEGRRGVVVAELSVTDLEQLFELRETLERKAAGLAAARGDRGRFRRLHEQFLHAEASLDAPEEVEAYYALVGELDAALDEECGNAYLALSLRQLRPHLQRLRRLAHDQPERLAASAREHAAIAAAVADGNPGLAAAATTVHLSASLKHLHHSQSGQGTLAPAHSVHLTTHESESR
ncbi:MULTISPECIES: GntR family transcriptional regulator [Arthrobacter]|uniref:GntR family transcriptional regulator n=2 Tax=Arthrobacter TaxID=1663 RepID=A0ABU9KPK0_9MICC|nr:GntR family transcriptional regulator [Arthrobacter sp. YJM1]MDP5228496.1 GntR family transcriptional regulator [Arthrobacter sp. YJM1]